MIDTTLRPVDAGCALMLHSLAVPTTSAERRYYLSPVKFSAFLKTLRMAGYRSVSVEQWLQRRGQRKQVLLTFDDGYDDLYSELLPMISEFGLAPLIFVVANVSTSTNEWDHTRGLRRRNLLNVRQMRELQCHGVRFGSHSMSHPWLPNLGDDALQREIVDSKHKLEDLLGDSIDCFSYPYGGFDERCRDLVERAGYRLGFTASPGLNQGCDPLTLKRAEISENDSLVQFLTKLRVGMGPGQYALNFSRSVAERIPSASVRSAVSCALRAVTSLSRSASRKKSAEKSEITRDYRTPPE